MQAESEQTNSALALGVCIDRELNVKSAGGYLVQVGSRGVQGGVVMCGEDNTLTCIMTTTYVRGGGFKQVALVPHGVIHVGVSCSRMVMALSMSSGSKVLLGVMPSSGWRYCSASHLGNVHFFCTVIKSVRRCVRRCVAGSPLLLR